MGYTSNEPLAGIPIYASAVNFPITAQDGEQAVAADTNTIYIYDTTTPGWAAVANPGAAIAIDALLGDVTATGPGVVAATIAPAAVTNSKLAAMSDNTIKGNKSGGPASPTDLALSDVVETGSSVLTITNGTDVIVGASNLTIEVAAESSAVDDTLVLRDSVGNFETASMAFDLSPSPAPAGAEGKLKWNATDGTLDLGMGGGNVTQQIGQEQYVRIVNKSGSAISDGQVVRLVGAQGQRAEGELALADAVANAKNTLGIATEDIANNAEGFVTTFGLVRNLNTNAYTEGDILYLSPTVPGGLTNVAPGNTYSRVQVGFVVVKDPSSGSILVQVHDEPSLGELSNVVLTAPSDGQVLEYDSGTSSWINATLSSLPTQTGNVNKVLATDGTTASWQYGGLGAGSLGDHNLVLGQAKPASIGTYNTLVGVQNATAVTGSGNAIFGSLNTTGLTSGSQNTFIGTNIQNITTGTGNIALGNNIYFANGAYTEVISIGNGAGVTGSSITAIGASHNVQGAGAVSIGYQVNSVNSDVNIGYQANSTNSSNSIIIGRTAHSGTGTNAVIIGSSSGKSGLSGASNTVVGQGSFNNAFLATAFENVIIGSGSGTGITSAQQQVIIGAVCGNGITSAYQSVQIGNHSAGNYNGIVAVGWQGSISGGSSVRVGFRGDAASESVSIGDLASTGSGGVAIGFQSNANTTKSVAIGYQASAYGAVDSVSVGRSAKTINSTESVAIGYLSGGDSNGIGNYNTSIGAYSGGLMASSATQNINLGRYAGYRSTSQTNELFIDNQLRTDYATQQAQSIIYGVMAATPATQTLALNAVVSVPQGITYPNYIISPSTDASLGIVGANFTINWALSPVAEVTVSAVGQLTITLSNPVNGGAYAVKITQGATPTTVAWPVAVKWPGGTAPTLSTTTGDVDVINFIYFTSTGFYYGTSALDFA